MGTKVQPMDDGNLPLRKYSQLAKMPLHPGGRTQPWHSHRPPGVDGEALKSTAPKLANSTEALKERSMAESQMKASWLAAKIAKCL